MTLTELSGSIAYKRNTVYEPNERCVWAIAPTDAARIVISMADNPFKPSEDGLLITEINRSNASAIVTTKL